MQRTLIDNRWQSEQWTPLAVIAFAVTWFLPEKPLRETAHIGAAEVFVEASGEPILDATAEEIVER